MVSDIVGNLEHYLPIRPQWCRTCCSTCMYHGHYPGNSATFGRVYNIYTAMALAVLIMSIFDAFVLWNIGFQLSTIGTLGIVVLTPLFQRLFRPIDRLPFAHLITETVAVTLAAQIATLPIFAFTFNQISIIAAPANPLTVPLLSTLILLGLVLCATGAIFYHSGYFVAGLSGHCSGTPSLSSSGAHQFHGHFLL